MAGKPNPLLVASAAIYFAAGVTMLFLPQELLAFTATPGTPTSVGLVQVLGSAVFGFSMLNWMTRHSRLGGIYGRPLVVANTAHAASAALLLGKIAARSSASAPFWIVVAVYAALAIGFGIHMFGRGPTSDPKPSSSK
jgi:hypothetical protein